MTKPVPPSAPDRLHHRRRIVVASVIALLAIAAGWDVLSTRSPPPPATAPIVATVPAVPPPVAPTPAPLEPAQTPVEPAPVPVVEAPPTPPPAAAPPPAAPAAPQPPPLKSVEVAQRPIHEVPPEKNPPPPDSTALDMTRPPPGVAGQHPSEGSTRAAPKQFAGPARVSGATSLTVGGVPVQLFGVKPPLPGDRCELGGVAMSCLDLAKKRLAERLGTSDQVNCRTPNPQPGMVVAFAICLDARGIDLGSYLLNEGLALADTGQSYDYVGAEGVARTLKHGLWKFR
jgi:endonuclease YncB( thermonuclease family)